MDSLLKKIADSCNKLSPILVLLIVFFMPIWNKLALLFIPLLVLVWILGGSWKKFIPEFSRNRFAQILILFWLLHLIGVLYSTNWKYGLLDVQQKLSFLIFPAIIITFSSGERFNITRVLDFFLIGSFISGMVCLTNAFYHSYSIASGHFVFNPVPQDALWENYFRYTRFSFLHHPSYLAMYFTFSIAILFKFIKENKKSVLLLLFYIALIIFFSLLIYFLLSRVGLVTLILTILIGLVWLVTNRVKWVLKFGVVGAIGILALGILLSVNKNSNIIKNFNQQIFYNLNPKKSEFNNDYDMRFYIWRSIPGVMSKNLVFGYGTGDFHIALNQEYNRRKLVDAAQMEMNAHNQFLESLVSLGLLGLTAMMLLIIYPAISLLKKEDNFLPILFIVIVTVNFLAESMLSRIAGILFFALFYSLFFCFNHKEA